MSIIVQKFVYNLIIKSILIISICKAVIIIPFKTYINEEINKINFNGTDLLSLRGDRKLYGEIEIGEPPQKVTTIISSETFATYLFKNRCDLKSGNYLKENSKTFIKKDEYVNGFNYLTNCYEIKETIYLSNNEGKKIKIENFNLIYSDNNETLEADKYSGKKSDYYEYHPYTCLNLGFYLSFLNGFEKDSNIVTQLKKNKKIINTYDWGIKFNSKNEGFLFFGEEPHIFDKNNFYELQYRISGAIYEKYPRDWILTFDKVFYTIKDYNNKLKNISLDCNYFKIEVGLGIMYAPYEYYELILRDLFQTLINKEKCFIENVKENKKIIYCNKDQENFLKQNFPILKLYMKQYKKIFEFTYNDLFENINNKIFFLVCFTSKELSYYFKIGNILLSKYFLIFNYDSKMIGYYNTELPGGNPIIEKTITEKKIRKINYFLLIILIIVFSFSGYLLGKKIYDRTRKKRLNELKDTYDYSSSSSSNIESNNFIAKTSKFFKMELDEKLN